jgi:uncharacterized membrane protein YphA (DoxX/SURF4 family)
MFVATLIVSILLAVVVAFSGYAKLKKTPQIVDTMAQVGVPAAKIPLLAYLEIAGAIGLIVGLFWWPIGVAAAIGVVLYFVGAVVAHVRVEDMKGIGPSAVLLVLSIAALVLRLLTV